NSTSNSVCVEVVERGRDRQVVRMSERRPCHSRELVGVLCLHLRKHRAQLRMRSVLELVRHCSVELVLQERTIALRRGQHRQVSHRRSMDVERCLRWEELRVSIAGEEERWICGAQKEDVVVEVDVSFAESGNVMKLRLYGMRVEHRQSIAVGEDLSVVDDSDLR